VTEAGPLSERGLTLDPKNADCRKLEDVVHSESFCQSCGGLIHCRAFGLSISRHCECKLNPIPSPSPALRQICYIPISSSLRVLCFSLSHPPTPLCVLQHCNGYPRSTSSFCLSFRLSFLSGLLSGLSLYSCFSRSVNGLSSAVLSFTYIL
jgi:hypothetical protein